MNLLPVILWLENGCDPHHAANELKIIQRVHDEEETLNREKVERELAAAIANARQLTLAECALKCDLLHHKWHWGGGNPVSGPSECAAAIRA